MLVVGYTLTPNLGIFAKRKHFMDGFERESILQDAQVRPESILPTIQQLKVDLDDQNWAIFFNDIFEKLFINKDRQLHVSVYQLISQQVLMSCRQNLRKTIDISSTPFTIVILNKTREVRFYSVNLSDELFIVQELNKNKSPLIDTEKFSLFSQHLELGASVDVGRFPTVLEELTAKFDLPDLINSEAYNQIETEASALTQSLVEEINNYRPAIFERVSDFALGLTAEYALLRIHLLKFLAILPSLDHDRSGKEVKRILIESLRRLVNDSKVARVLGRIEDEKPLPIILEQIFSVGLQLCKFLPQKALAGSVRFMVRLMATRFIAGEKIEEASSVFSSLNKNSRDATLDQLGELVVSESEADQYMNEVLKLIQGLGQHYTVGLKNKAGILRSHVSIKVSALCSDFKPEAFDYTYDLVAPRLIKILLAAKKHQVFLNIDAEHYDYRDLVFAIYEKVLLTTDELRDFQQTGIVLQAYLRDCYEHFCDILELSKKRGLLMPIRLVKGAYWDAETVHAKAHTYNAPQFLNKEETDLHFRQMLIKILENGDHVQLCLAGHNFSDHAFAEVARQKLFPTSPVIEHQCLHMTYEALSNALASMNWPTRNYVPIGSLIVGMAYLVRRIMENSSQVGVLTIMRSHKNRANIATPKSIHLEKKRLNEINRDNGQQVIRHGFSPVTPVLMYKKSHLSAVQHALNNMSFQNQEELVENSFPVSGDVKVITSNSDPQLVLGQIQFASESDVKLAVEKSFDFYRSSDWTIRPAIERSIILVKAAQIMLASRLSLSTLIVQESGKIMAEALADVDEAIDFLHFYARQIISDERQNPRAHSRGVLAVITPWNFPLAIPCGMVSSALISGNSVILKSAEQTPLIAQKMVDIFHFAGVPKDCLIHLPGEGETVGEALISHPQVAGAIFTGSKTVGLHIAHTVGKRIIENPIYKTKYPAKVITEMGGKNAIIVTANAELDETVSGIIYSAFAHAGQKCSAASRVIVHETVIERLAERLGPAVRDISIGKAWDLSTYLNTVVTKEDRDRLRTQISEAVNEAKNFGGRVIANRSQEELPGYCIGPAIIQLPYDRAFNRDSYSQKELFGPVVHLIPFKTLDSAIKVFNSTEYALTGGIFSQSQDDIDYLSSRMECGNLYINRPITGARVGIEPFGGFKLSGTGPKAGSFHYLPAFKVTPLSFPIVNKLTTASLEDGLHESSTLKLADFSMLSVEDRILRVERAIQFVINNFEYLYQGIYGENKEVLVKLKSWANGGFKEFLTGTFNNVEIPGQLSFNDFSLSTKQVLIISYEKRAYLSSLTQFIAAVANGSGVSIACRNEESFFWWTKLVGLFFKAGISSNNIHVQQISKTALINAVSGKQVSTIIVDGKIEVVAEILERVYNHQFNEKEMIKVITPHDAPDIEDFHQQMNLFSNCRSFAVNTMRHGAPLELDL